MPTDPGNWTGNRTGVGVLCGTKFGISAGAYPDENIEALTLECAFDLYFRDYRTRTGADDVPPLLRDLVLDSAVNNGPGNAACFPRRALDVADPIKLEESLSARKDDPPHGAVELGRLRLGLVNPS